MNPLFSWQFQEDELIEASTISVWDRGFRYGMSVFETILIHRGRMVLGEDHIRRLQEASRAAGFSVPTGLLDSLMTRLAHADESMTCMLRVYVTAGEGSPLADATASRIYIIVEEVVMPGDGERADGWKLHLSRAPMVSVLGGWKTGNYWPHVQALAEARRNGCQEAVIPDMAGNVVSASMANLFAVIDGELRTPPLMVGARDGVVRSWVLKNSSAREDLITVDDLARATECFVTNSRIGILPVREIDGRELPSRSVGRLLYDTYRENVLAS